MMNKNVIANTMLKEKIFGILAVTKKIDVVFFVKALCVYIFVLLLGFAYITYAGPKYLAKQQEAFPSKISALVMESDVKPSDDGAEQHSESKEKAETLKNKPILIEGLLETTNVGDIPTIRKSDNLTSFRAYQTPYNLKSVGTKKAIAFAVLDYGLSEQESNTILENLPAEASLILSPYAQNIDSWMAKAQSKGHEVWLNLPIQNQDAKDIGSKTIFHHMPYGKKRTTSNEIMSRTSGYVGIASFTDETSIYAQEDYLELTNELFSRGLGFFEMNKNAPNIIASKALVFGAPYLKSDISIYKITGPNSFNTLENESLKTKKNVIATVPPYPKTIKALSQWIDKIGKVDYAIVPVSAIYDIPLYQNNN